MGESLDARLRIPISLKLVVVTVVLILTAVLPIAFRSAQLFESSFGRSQHDTNAELANMKSSDIDDLMLSFVEKIRTLSNLISQDFIDDEQRKRVLEQAFGHDLDLVSLDLYQLENGRPKLYKRHINEAFLKPFGFDAKYIDRVRKEKAEAVPLLSVFANKSKILIRNTTLPNGLPLFSIAVPFPDEFGVIRQIAVGDFRLSRLQKAFALSGVRTLFLVDEKGVVLAHKNDTYALQGRSIEHLPIVEEALARHESNKGQKRFFDQDEKKWLVGAYSKTAFGLTVIAEAPEMLILEPAKVVKLEAFEVAGYVLSGALFFVILFSLTLTSPIEDLHEATQIVASGNFDVFAPVTTRDEVGELASSFNRMVVGLKERDKVKNILTKFHGSSITDDLMKNDLHLGGNRKDVTVFFSDIRGFTKFSEGHTPEEVVEMLNEYFQIMVSIITKNHGVVDKFVGDAIMAVWGAPTSTGDDRYWAVIACLEMRIALNELNERRQQRGHSPILIGMGLHSGTAISGTIGSTERMEYTVIGDTVNMASRIESSTKAFGADLLISGAVAHDIESRFLLDFAGSAEVKGKTEPIKMFKVRGRFENGASIPITTPYSDYQAEHADKVKVAS